MSYSSLNIRALQAFVAVYEEQSFSRAAEREFATQSGMSTQVKNLELKLGTPLLNRERGNYTLTPAGQIVYREAQGILRALMATEKAVQEIQSAVTGHVRFGMIPALTRDVLTPALRDFQARFPAVELTLIEEYSHSLMRRVLDGDLDFAMVPAGESPNGVTGSHVGRDREMLVSSAARDSAYPHLGPAPLSALDGARLIMPSQLNVRRKRLDAVLATYSVQPAETIFVDGMLATIEMIAASGWVAVLPSAICHSDKSGTIRRLNVLENPPINTDYVTVRKTEIPGARAARLLSECLKAHTNVILSDWDDLDAIPLPDWSENISV